MKYLLSVGFIFLCLCCYGQSVEDSIAIVKVLEKESATWRSGDVKAHADCWKIEPYSIVLISTADGKTFSVPPHMMIQSSADMGKGGTSVNSNYKMSIHPDNAWVSHNEVSISKTGRKTYSYEIRMLEKVKGKWKLVGQSIHLYKP